MRRFVTLAATLAVLGMTASPAVATDQTTFDKLVEKTVPSLDELFSKFKPTVLCVCDPETGGLTSRAGVVAHDNNGHVGCYPPGFFPDGSLAFFDLGSHPWVQVTK